METRNQKKSYDWGPEEPLISPREAPESSWLENESAPTDELNEEDASEDLIEVDLELEDGEKDMGA